jgi:hypothetical protein
MDKLGELIDRTQPGLRDVYLGVHSLMSETFPDVRHAVDLTDGGIGYGARQYGYDGWGMAAVVPHRSWISLVLFKGGLLGDPDGVLEGTGAAVRHIKIRSVDELTSKREVIGRLLAEAARFYKQ